jgi:C4-dicarboxylate-specific signal transduction histidine kinase
LTASIAHEVNQPLSGIMTNASTCLRMLVPILRTSTARVRPRGGRFETATALPM